MKRKSLLLSGMLCCLTCISNLTAQEHKCGFDHQHESFEKANPKAKMSNLELLRKIGRTRVIKAPTNGQYVIPVVFHVFGEPTNHQSLKVTYELIEEALKQTSEDFQGLTSDYDQTGPDSRFEQIKKPANIDFRLAKIDPSGAATKGVIFYDEAMKGFGNGSGYDELIQKYAWDNSKYMNVYIMSDLYDDADLYNSGVSWLPNNWMTSNNLARVVYNGSYIGSNTTENFRRVLSHEFGHFFGLPHTFQGACTYPNDGIEDTPPVEKPQWPANTLNCEGKYTDWENFMNYTDAYRHFTKGQVDEMEKQLNESMSRSLLWQDDNLLATGVNNGFTSTPSVVVTKGKYFVEDIYNNGKLEGSIELETTSGLSFAKTGILTEGVDYSIGVLPSGTTIKVSAVSSTKAKIVMEGNAQSHNISDGIDNIKLTMNPSLFESTGGTPVAQNIYFGISFMDPYTAYCSFNPRYAPCAHISKVQFAQIEKNTEFDNYQFKDFRKDFVAGLDKGKTYQLKVKVENCKSGQYDPYTVRAWFDWNGDYIFQPEEMITPKYIMRIGKAGTVHDLSLDVTVPEHFVANKEVGFRVMLHYTLNDDGEDPCGIIDSGDVEDYGMIPGEENAHVLPPDDIIVPQDKVCVPDFSYRPYAYIEKVEFANISNSSPATLDDIIMFEDYSQQEDLTIKLERNKTYKMVVSCRNIDSGKDDPYTVRAYVDWNRNNVLEKKECLKAYINKVGAANALSTVEFDWTVPEDAVLDEKTHVRVFLHFGGETSFAGENPCSEVENGQIEDYKAIVTAPTGLTENPANRINIYPNPTKGLINLEGADFENCNYMLYSISGQILRKGVIVDSTIDFSKEPKGIYILKIELKDTVIQKSVIIN